MGDVKKLYPKNAAEKADNVLEQAVGVYDQVLIIGYDHEGCLEVRSSTGLNFANLLWLAEAFKSKLINGDYFA